MSSLTTFILIWGVWLITPVLVDGFEAIGRLIIVRSRRKTRRRQRPVDDYDLPSVTVIVPAHNEAAVIDRCLNSVKAQDYPSDKLEIIVVDDGSTDETADRVENHVNGNGNGQGSNGFRLRGRAIQVGPFAGKLTLIKNGHGGKAHALNAGIEASTGEIVINIDSDVVLAFDAVRRVAESFHRHPKMGAATGNIEIDWEILEARDDAGNLILDENGDIQPKQLGAVERFLAKAQFLEYLASFDLGRRSQAETGTMYTLAGACSAFRRSVIAAGVGYSNATVSEDTCLTFDLHRKDVEVGFIEDAKVFLEPVIDWDALYAQRVRWTRGQLEVCGMNEDLIGKKERGTFSRFAVPKMLLFDHTLAFPRLVWAPLLLFFPLIGYSWRIVTLALIAMYLFYLLIEIVNTLATFSIADPHSRERIEKCGWALLGLPIYRFIVFHFRFSGFLVTLTEEQKWTMTGPMQTAQSDMRTARLRSIEFVSGMLGIVAVSLTRAARMAWTLVGPLMFAVMIVVDTWLDKWKRNA